MFAIINNWFDNGGVIIGEVEIKTEEVKAKAWITDKRIVQEEAEGKGELKSIIC